MKSFEVYDRACRAIADLPEGWSGNIFKTVGHPADRQGVLVTGAVSPPITRGPRKGEANWPKRDLSTEREIFVSHAAYSEALSAQAIAVKP